MQIPSSTLNCLLALYGFFLFTEVLHFYQIYQSSLLCFMLVGSYVRNSSLANFWIFNINKITLSVLCVLFKKSLLTIRPWSDDILLCFLLHVWLLFLMNFSSNGLNFYCNIFRCGYLYSFIFCFWLYFSTWALISFSGDRKALAVISSNTTLLPFPLFSLGSSKQTLEHLDHLQCLLLFISVSIYTAFILNSLPWFVLIHQYILQFWLFGSSTYPLSFLF